MDSVRVETYSGDYFYLSKDLSHYNEINELMQEILKEEKYILHDKIIYSYEIISVTIY